jgi:hypothetical protein
MKPPQKPSPPTGYFKILEDLLKEQGITGLQIIAHRGRFYYFSGTRYYEASNKMEATKAIREYQQEKG